MGCCNQDHEHAKAFEGKWYQFPPIRNASIAGVITGLAFLLAHLFHIPSWIEKALYVVAMPVGGYYWIQEGIEQIREEHEISIDVLMLAAAVGAMILGMWDEAATLVFLYGIAEGVEEFTYSKTRHSITKLLDLVPKEAYLLKDGKEIVIPAEQLNVGDLFRVRPGETIATDGIVIDGRSSVNEAPVTGESIPVEKNKGMKIFAGTLNKEGALTIQVTASFQDNTLSKIVHLVEEAQEQKSKNQLFIEKFGRKYSPIVLLTALLLTVVPPLFGASLSVWAIRAVVLLVAAAPCALVMSTPVAIAAGIGTAGRNGVLIKGGMHLENLGKVKAIAFDKTGTLTSGKPIVTDIIAVNGTPSDLMTIVCSIERYSEHPLSRAIVKKGKELNCKLFEAKDFESLSGFGVKATIAGKTVLIGKPELFRNFGWQAKNTVDVDKLRNEGKTIVYIGTSERLEGVIAIRDEIRPQSKGVIEGLKGRGFGVMMLTGDSALTSEAIAKDIGIQKIRANLKPDEKITAIKEMKQKYGAVAMVGDGINDAPALAESTVGIAMGTAGTDEAIEAADVALMADDLEKVAYAIQLGAKVRRISRQNIIFSLVLLSILIPLALFGIMGVAAAVVVHEGSEIIAVLNGLRVAK
ncbi:MAG: heavy metal translocating P-type ATPase [bacterium]